MLNLREDAKNVFIYAYPLITTEAIHLGADDRHFEHCREFPTSEYRRIVKLNMDTLYSYAWTQLKNSPYLIHIPKITERYFLFPVMDAYTNVIYSIGTRTPQMSAGDYIFLYREEPVPKEYKNYRVLRSEDSLNSILLRIETRGKEDYKLVNRLQDQFRIEPLYPERIEPVPPAHGVIPAEYPGTLSSEEYFTRFSELSADNPIKDPEILQAFERLGYQSAAAVFDYSKVSSEQKAALEQGMKDGMDLLRQPGRFSRQVVRSNGWLTILGDAGTYGTNYLQRASTARTGWGANIPQDSLYSIATEDRNGSRFYSDKKYILHIEADGYPRASIFWSITLYGEKSKYPVKNKINRYSVNTYNIRQNKVEVNADGSLDLYIAREEPEDEHKRKNWLPAPIDDEHFSLTIRNYWPDEISLAGRWEPPQVKESLY
ncbi:MAG: DUF1254 domain-containing protein [Lachnospiraceae bacterium]|nr:DUF1254 domain-containing protein [Lachnospiraceae bacterium]